MYCFFLYSLSLHFATFGKSFTQSFTTLFVLMNLYVYACYMQGWRFNDFFGLLNVTIKIDLKFLGLWNDNKVYCFKACGFQLCVNMVHCFEAFGFWFYVIMSSKFCSRCSLLRPCYMIQNGYKIKLLLVGVDCEILECNTHFCEIPIEQSHYCVATTCTNAIRFKFMMFTHDQVCWQLP
jgi:hypothetical protein